MSNATDACPPAQPTNGRPAQHPACPSWCRLTGAHPFTAAGFRIHQRRVGAWMTVEQVETCDHSYSPTVAIDDDVELSPEQAHVFAANLAVAAGIIRGGPVTSPAPMHIVELNSDLHGRDWTLFRDLDIIGIRVGLSEEDRRRALAEALAEHVAVTDAGIAAGRELALADAGIAAGGRS